MISRKTQSKISDIFITLAEAERDVEVTRQVLTENKDYNSYQIFCYLDSDKKNKIDESDIINYLKSKNIFATEIEAKLVILYYDQDLDKYLNYNEFLNLIESKLSPKREKQEITGPLCFSIDYALTKLLEKEIIHARQILNLFGDLRGFSDFNIHDIFHLIKSNNITCIIPQNLIYFLNKNYASFIDQDIELIFKRIDFNKDNVIDLCEFHIFFGYPNCGYSCPFQKCDNCGIECCQTCRINEPCYVHKYINNKDENYMQKRIYKTYYTEFQNKSSNNNKNSNDFSSAENNQFNNGIQKVSQNLTLKLSPKREYAPFEVCLNADFYENDENNYNNGNIMLYSNNDHTTNNDNNKNNFRYSNNNNINTLNQKFLADTNNKISISNANNQFKDIDNSQKYSTKQNDNNDIDSKNNNIERENNEHLKNTNSKIINSYESLKKSKSNNTGNKNKNQYEENQFIDYLKEAMLHESKIEQLKIELSLRSDFNWEKVFRIFELEGRGYLSKEDLIIGFNKFGLYPKDSDISLLFKRYDLKKEGFINYPNFFDLIVPFSKYHRIMVDKRKIKEGTVIVGPEEFSQETLNCLRNLFMGIFNGEFILNKIKESFTSLKIKFSDIFKLLDPTGTGFIDEKELAIFMQKNGIFKSNNECDLLFLRLNKARNGQIEFQEMCDEIEPIL
jgi:Ca2+-binding EF-hand superfamily protein